MNFSISLLCGIILLILSLAGGQIAAFCALIGLALYAVLGLKQALFSLLLLSLITIVNGDVFPIEGPITSAMRWVVLFAAGGSVAVYTVYAEHDLKTNAGALVLLAFLSLAFFLSNVYGYAPAVSNFKLLSFGLGSITIIQGLLNLRNADEFDRLTYHTVAAILLLSVAIHIALPIEAYKRNIDLSSVSGFRGVSNHSQIMGVLTGMIIAWLIAMVASNKMYRVWHCYLLIIGYCVYMIISNARTGPVALLVSATVTFGLSVLSPRVKVSRSLLTIFKKTLGLWPIVVLALIAFSERIVEGVTLFALKGGRNGQDIAVAFEASRGFRLRQLYLSFMDNFWTGIGFGLPTIKNSLRVVYDPFINTIPVKASIEKNIVFLAVFEETGFFGGSLFLLFIVIMARYMIRHKGPEWCFLFLTGIFMNIGEAIFFSLGNIGLMCWVLMSSGLASRGNVMGPIRK